MSDNNDNSNQSMPGPAPAPVDNPPIKWEREVLEKLVFATLKEQRANRRWSIFFKVSMLALIFFAVASYFGINLMGGDAETLGRHTALIEIEGSIETEGSGADPFAQQGFFGHGVGGRGPAHQ
jgi:protease-4